MYTMVSAAANAPASFQAWPLAVIAVGGLVAVLGLKSRLWVVGMLVAVIGGVLLLAVNS